MHATRISGNALNGDDVAIEWKKLGSQQTEYKNGKHGKIKVHPLLVDHDFLSSMVFEQNNRLLINILKTYG